MTMMLRRAVREQVPLFIGLSAGTGAGKTMSAMKLATGIAGRANRFAVIDTESGRSKHYAPKPGEQPDFKETFNFDVLELDAPYSSVRYQEAIESCKAYPCIVVDQATFEHIGPGGHLERQHEIVLEKVRRAKEKGDKRPDWVLEEAYSMSAWKEVKHERKLLVMALIAVRVPVIFCFRAEEKMEMKEVKETGTNGKEYKKTVIIAAKDRPLKERWQPICGKEFEPEMLAFFLLTRDNPKGRGVPTVLKLNEQHSGFVNIEKPLDEEAGKLFAAWASGGSPALPTNAEREETLPAETGAGNTASDAAVISADQCASLETKAQDGGVPLASLRKAAGVDRLAQIAAKDYDRAEKWLDAAIAKRRSA